MVPHSRALRMFSFTTNIRPFHSTQCAPLVIVRQGGGLTLCQHKVFQPGSPTVAKPSKTIISLGKHARVKLPRTCAPGFNDINIVVAITFCSKRHSHVASRHRSGNDTVLKRQRLTLFQHRQVSPLKHSSKRCLICPPFALPSNIRQYYAVQYRSYITVTRRTTTIHPFAPGSN